MRRSLALIAVAAAVAAAAAVVIAGVGSGDGAGASTGQQAAGGALPSGHPSIAAQDGDAEATPTGATTPAAVAQVDGKGGGSVQDLLDLGDAYFTQQHLQQAEQAYSRALDRQPGNAAAQVGLAMVWHARGDSKRAEKALEAVIAAHPDDQNAHYSLAIVYFSGGRTDLAKLEWQKAATIDPTSVTGRRSQSFVDLIEGKESATPEAGAGN